jgi:hypothetical protein
MECRVSGDVDRKVMDLERWMRMGDGPGNGNTVVLAVIAVEAGATGLW